MNKKQWGMGLSGLLMGAVVLAMLALLGMKIGPEYMEYFNIVKAVKAATNDADGSTSVAQVRKSFERYAIIDRIQSINASDLEVTKEDGKLVAKFAYERRVHLFKNISILIEFEGSNK